MPAGPGASRFRFLPSLDRTLHLTLDDQRWSSRIPRERLAAWLLGLRWVAVLVVFATLTCATMVSDRVPTETAQRLWLLWAALTVYNGVLSLVAARRLASDRALSLQMAGDVVLLGAFVHVGGGIQNPFASLFALHAVVAAVVLERHLAVRVLIGTVGVVLALTFVEVFGLAAPGCLLAADGACRARPDGFALASAGVAVSVLAAGCAMIVITLVSHLRTDRDRLGHLSVELAVEAERLDTVQRDLTTEQVKLKLIVDCMNDAVIFAAPNGRVLLCNRAAAGMLAPRPGATNDVYVCHEPHVWDKLLAKLIDPGPSESHPLLEIGGRQYEATYARVDGPAGELFGAVMVARDVTERLQEQVSRMQKERMATVGKLAAALAHELNNPLGAIALFSQHALKGLEPRSRLAEHLSTVLRNADLCKKIVRDLLEYARQRPPESRRFPIEDLLGDVGRTLAPYCAQQRIALETTVDPRLPRQAVGDPVQLRQLLVNLGLNAVEAMRRGGRLMFRASGADGVLRFEVEDTGPGVDAVDRDRIFSAFYTTKSEGTGLGLAVARDIAEAHGGQLDLDPSYTAGARFVLSIPVRSLPSARAEEAA